MDPTKWCQYVPLDCLARRGQVRLPSVNACENRLINERLLSRSKCEHVHPPRAAESQILLIRHGGAKNDKWAAIKHACARELSNRGVNNSVCRQPPDRVSRDRLVLHGLRRCFESCMVACNTHSLTERL